MAEQEYRGYTADANTNAVTEKESPARLRHRIEMYRIRVMDLEDRDFFLTSEIDRLKNELFPLEEYNSLSVKEKISVLEHELDMLKGEDGNRK